MNAPEKPSPTGTQARSLAGRIATPFGIAMTFVVFALIVVPALVRERAPRLPGSEVPSVSVGWLDQAEAPAAKGRDLPPVDPATVMKPTPALLARGESSFKQNCTSCHGEAGHGDGPASGTLNPRPRNFTQPVGWTHGYRMTDIFSTITAGVKGTGMNAFDFIAPADRMALVHYVRSLGAFDHGAEDARAIAALEEQFRSKGMHIPNRIPVSLAIKKMVQEESAVRPALPSGNAALPPDVIADPARVARTLAGTNPNDDWQTIARAWAAGAPSNGFAPSVAAMDSAKWQHLVSTLLGRPVVAEAKDQEREAAP
jgi:mono/diheme cytochrome c family protein